MLLWNVVPTHPGTRDLEPAADADGGRSGGAVPRRAARGRVAIAVGRLAAAGLDAPYVRHPSHGGAAEFEAGIAPGFRYNRPPAGTSPPLSMKTYSAKPGEDHARVVSRRRRGQDARPARDPDRRHAPRQAQAAVHAARRHRRLRDRRERREDPGHRQQARPEAVLPPLGLSGRPAQPDAARAARPPADRGAPRRGEGDAPQEPARAAADHEAQDLRRPRASARGPEPASPLESDQ